MPQQSQSTHVLMQRQLVLYQRGNSGAWQCRFKCGNIWQRTTTKETDFKRAVERARQIWIEAEIRKRENLPVVTRRFRDIAKLAVERMQQELKSGKGKVSFNDYIRVIHDYLVPILGKRSITNIDLAALDELDTKRADKMGRAPSKSTLLTHNSALNRVFDEAQMRGFLTEANRPKLESNGRRSQRRAAFSMTEIRAMLAAFDGWIARARDPRSQESRLLMRDYVYVLLDTGARPGVELLDLTWSKVVSNQVEPKITQTDVLDHEHAEFNSTVDFQRSCMLNVKGKTGAREIIGMARTVTALRNIAQRNYPDVEQPLLDPLRNIARGNNKALVFRRKDGGDASSSFQKLFDSFLREHNLLEDPTTGQNRVFYSLRHTYATFALTHDRVPVHTLAKQMGTSVLMIEKHYSHLNVRQAIPQLRGNESRMLIDAAGEPDQDYSSARAA